MCVAGIPISDGVEGGGTLVIEKQLSVRGTYLVWETPKVSLVYKAHCVSKQAVLAV